MTKTHINARLIAILPKVLRISNVDVIDASELSESTWYRIAREPNRITVQQLLSMANGLHVPVRRFFSFDGYDYIGTREDYIMEDGYKECRYDDTSVRKVIGPGTNITWAAAADSIGLNWTRAEPVLLSSSRLPIDSFLKFCDTFKFEPFRFIVDPNPINQSLIAGKKQRKHITEHLEDTDRENALRMEIEEIKKSMSQLQASYDMLRKEHHILLDAYNKLEHSVSVKIDTVNSSHLAIFAEPEAEYGKEKEEEK